MPPFNTAMVNGFNTVFNDNKKLGSWPAYLEMRETIMKTNEELQPALSRTWERSRVSSSTWGNNGPIKIGVTSLARPSAAFPGAVLPARSHLPHLTSTFLGYIMCLQEAHNESDNCYR
jgi:hypothetical protein